MPEDRLPEDGLGIERQARAHTSLEQVVRFALGRGAMIREVVRQDEYTLDVVLPLDGLVLVYDTT